jgi:hypothetical protein
VLPLRARTLELDGLPFFIQKWTLAELLFPRDHGLRAAAQAGIEVGKQDFLGGV